MSYYEDEYDEPEYEIENTEKNEKGKTLEIKCDLEVLKNQIVNDIKYKVKEMVIKEIKSEVKKKL